MTEDEKRDKASDLIWSWRQSRSSVSIGDAIWLLDTLCEEYIEELVREDKESKTGMCLRCGRCRKGP